MSRAERNRHAVRNTPLNMPDNAQNLRPERCRHCGAAIPALSVWPDYCCAGCEAVHKLLIEQGLGKYYAVAQGQLAPAPEVNSARSLSWLAPLLEKAESAPGELCSLTFDVRGIHCAACVWLMEELSRRAGESKVVVNPALGTLGLTWKKGFAVEGFVRQVESFGYRFAPHQKGHRAQNSEWTLRLGISAALAINTMIFSFSLYTGLSAEEGFLFRLFTHLSMAFSSVVVVVGGWPFFRSAWQGVRRGVLHLDLPIALGIALVYATSMAQHFSGRAANAYFDTLNVFVTLMLLGRWLQERVLEKNRRYLLEETGAENVTVRRISNGVIESVAASSVRADDVLLLPPGDWVPVDSELLSAQAEVSTEWTTGEPGAHTLSANALLSAGALNAGNYAFTVRAKTEFCQSPLLRLFAVEDDSSTQAGAQPFWSRLSKSWALGVLILASVGAFLWWQKGPEKALDVAAALLVVTCPCALGIATPLAYEMAQAKLRKQGFFIRKSGFLDRLLRVKKVLLDKTGTVTINRLALADEEPLHALSSADRDVLYTISSQSHHPVSQCLARELAKMGATFQPDMLAREMPGKGIFCEDATGEWRLGKADWAGVESGLGPVFSHNGRVLAVFELKEALRADAHAHLRHLAEDNELWLISGDDTARVSRLATELNIPETRVLSKQSPEDKAQAVRRIDARDTLYLGDGVNDSLAFEEALCAGTPSVDRPVVPGKSDFFLLGEGLGGLLQAFSTARHLRQVVVRSLTVSLVYNALAVTACLLGLMTPLRAAIAMPANSLFSIALVLWAFRARSEDAVGSVLKVRPA